MSVIYCFPGGRNGIFYALLVPWVLVPR